MRGAQEGWAKLRTARTRASACAAAAAIALAGAAAGCGSGGSSTSTVTVAAVPPSPLASAQAAKGGAAVAYVAGTPISTAAYTHWLAIERKLGGSTSASHRALGFLITSQWVVGEAARRHLAVAEAEVKRHYEQAVRQSFPQAGAVSAFLARSGESAADVEARVKVELLRNRIAAQVAAGTSTARRTAAMASFENGFHARWKALTRCAPGYVMEDCQQYHGGPEDLTATTGSSTTPTAAAGAHHSATPSRSASGEVPPTPGGFAVSSPAFSRNGAIPAQYTCAGAGTSPPLSWGKAPAGAAELVVFVIDDTSSSSSGGIRWIVGGIDPSSTGVAAGHVPAGGIVGTNTAGKAAYSPICPAPGHTDTVEVVVYALKKTIPLTPGFQPAVAEHEYGSGKLVLGEAAVTYGVASR